MSHVNGTKRDYGCFSVAFRRGLNQSPDHRYAPGVSWTCPPLVEWGRLALIRTTSAPPLRWPGAICVDHHALRAHGGHRRMCVGISVRVWVRVWVRAEAVPTGGQGVSARDAPRGYTSPAREPPRQPSSTTDLAALGPARPRRADRALRHRRRRHEDLSGSTHNAAGAAARQRARPLVDHATAHANATSPDREMRVRSRRQTVNRPHRRQEGLAAIPFS